jgi:hypothetical protein
MAILSDPDREAGFAKYLRDRNAEGGGVPLTKNDIRAAFNALDDFFSTNAAAVNQTIPQPARSGLTTAQKATLAISVLERRYLSGVSG